MPPKRKRETDTGAAGKTVFVVVGVHIEQITDEYSEAMGCDPEDVASAEQELRDEAETDEQGICKHLYVSEASARKAAQEKLLDLCEQHVTPRPAARGRRGGACDRGQDGRFRMACRLGARRRPLHERGIRGVREADESASMSCSCSARLPPPTSPSPK